MNLTKQFFKYVSQNIFGLLGTSCYILADTYFISQAAGTDGVTLLNLCLPVYNFIFAVGSMVGLGAATRYAILKAQGDERCQRYFSNAIFCACVLSVPFLLVGIFAPGGLLRLMGGDAGIMALGIPYARIFLMFTPFFMCNYIVSAFVRNDGDPSLAMVATLSSSLFNVVFDYIFMFPMGLGLAGAALATGIGQTVTLVLYLVVYCTTASPVRLRRKALRPDLSLEGRLYAIGVPAILNLALPSLLVTFLNGLLAAFSESYVVVLGIYYKLQTFLYLPASGIVQGMRPLIGYNYGAKEYARVAKLYQLTLGMSAVIMAAGTVICMAASAPLIGLFSSTPETIAIGQTALRIICLGFVVSAVSTTSSGALEGLGKGAASLVISLCRYVIFIMPLAWLLCRQLGPTGVWHAFWVTEVLSAVIAFAVYRKSVIKK